MVERTMRAIALRQDIRIGHSFDFNLSGTQCQQHKAHCVDFATPPGYPQSSRGPDRKVFACTSAVQGAFPHCWVGQSPHSNPSALSGHGLNTENVFLRVVLLERVKQKRA